MNLTPQVETAEMPDAELDGISGGQAAGDAAAGLYVEAGPLDICAGGAVAASTQGFSAEGNLHTALH